jgi:hypothetical protein
LPLLKWRWGFGRRISRTSSEALRISNFGQTTIGALQNADARGGLLLGLKFACCMTTYVRELVFEVVKNFDCIVFIFARLVHKHCPEQVENALLKNDNAIKYRASMYSSQVAVRVTCTPRTHFFVRDLSIQISTRLLPAAAVVFSETLCLKSSHNEFNDLMDMLLRVIWTIKSVAGSITPQSGCTAACTRYLSQKIVSAVGRNLLWLYQQVK